ncbi:hypothetical protein [Pseudorhodoferax sp. Leaf274]|uniref:hypothetical protein n=1 Tax=Pseudorhodoferax sp. Leaf274 TaxID=1736318 RepID=UPI0012E242A1|nr:hypothetical protein [Pseudorhodoferax sp. Leaf274]
MIKGIQATRLEKGIRMTSMRKRKSIAARRWQLQRRRLRELEDQIWDRMPPVGREFGSPDFERLMAEDDTGMAGMAPAEAKHAAL